MHDDITKKEKKQGGCVSFQTQFISCTSAVVVCGEKVGKEGGKGKRGKRVGAPRGDYYNWQKKSTYAD